MSDEVMANQSQEAAQETAQEQTQQVQEPNTEQATTQETQSTQAEPFLRIKYNKEEIPLTMEEAAELAQKGKNYEKAVERAKQEARDAYIAEQGYMWNDKPITTEAEYNRALQEKALQDQGIDPNALYSALDRHPVMQQAKQVLQEKQLDTLAKEPFFNELKPRVLQLMQSIPGMDVNTAYTHMLGEMVRSGGLDNLKAQYEEQISQLKQGIQVKDKNAENAGKSTGSVTGQGNPPSEFFSRDQVEKMSQAEVDRNLNKIMESMRHW